MVDSIRLTRQELYDRVWSTPAWKLGPELGLSGRGLAKRCAREGIPVPNRGYWAKKEFGWTPTPAKLPARKPDQSETIEFALFRSDASLEVENAKPPPDRVPIPEVLANPHPLVEATRKAARKAKQQEDRTLALHGPGGLTMRVSRASLDRALRILDGLSRALEAKGCKLRPADGKEKVSAALQGPDAVGFLLEEEVTRTERPLRDWQLRDKARNPWRYSTPRYKYEPSGRLRLRLSLRGGSGVRGTWGDGARQKLDALLPRAVETILGDLTHAQHEREEAERRRQELERQRLERAAADLERFQNDRRAQIARGRFLAWRDLQQMNIWLAEAREHQHPGTDGAVREKWVRWIEGYIEGAKIASLRFPPFEAEPTPEERTKNRLWDQ
jgi:hypothetical protein